MDDTVPPPNVKMGVVITGGLIFLIKSRLLIEMDCRFHV